MDTENRTDTPVEMPEEACAEQEAPQDAAKDKKTLKKEARKAKKAAKKAKKKQKKLARKQLRRDVRQRKKDEFRARGCLGRIFWFFGKLLSMIAVVAVLVTVIQVNYLPVSRFVMQKIVEFTRNVDVDAVTPDQIADILPVDAENAAAIDASAPIEEGETWAIYMYMVGSDLESSSNAQLSTATQFLTGVSAGNYIEENKTATRSMITGFMKDIMAKGMDLPTFFYKKAVPDVVPDWMVDIMANILNFDQGELYAASLDIEEMLEVKLPENVKVVFQPGGAGEWSYDKINPNRTQRFVYDADGVREVYNEQITSMARAQTLEDFLRYCRTEHPADNTMVLFWNHGGGAFGYGADQLFGGDMLSLKEMREAFEAVCVPDEENPPFDIIGFDACLMASMEVANTFNGFASYLLGSEDVEPGYGWDYTAWLGALAENPQMNPLQLGKAISDSYIDFYCRYSVAMNSPVTQMFSMLDLSKADDLNAAYERLMAKALDDTAENPGVPALLGACANRSIKYAGEYHSYYNTLDLGMFMEEAAAYYPQEAGEVKKLVDEMVLYNLASGIYKQSQGVTVYYPSTITDLDGILQALKYIDEVCPSEDIRTLYYYKIAGCLRDEMLDYVAKMGYGEIKPMDPAPLRAMTAAQVTILEDQNYAVAADPAALALTQSVEYNLVAVQADGTAKRLGAGTQVYADENGSLHTAFDGKWLHMDGHVLPVNVISATKDMITCNVTITHNMQPAYLMVGYDVAEDAWKLLGVHNRESSDSQIISTRTTTELKAGDRIRPVYTTYAMDTGIATEKQGEAITYTEQNKLEARTLEDGEYFSFIRMTDARGDEYNLPVVSFKLEKGVMKDAQAGVSYNITAL